MAGSTGATDGGGRELERTASGEVPDTGVDEDDEGTALDRVRATSREMDARRRTIFRERAATPRPPLAPIAGGVLVLVAIALLVSQGNVYPREPGAQVDGQRSLGMGVIAAAAGLRFMMSRGRHLLFAAAALAAGGVLVLSGLLADHLTQGPVVLEVSAGVVVLLATAAAVASPRR